MTEYLLPRKLTLDQFMKREGWVGTGGQAKYVIQSEMVRVNGAVETRRGRQMVVGDVVEFEGQRAVVQEDQDDVD
ncbi:RNA-binding S4 domain-containing protein [Planctellipticum variicoloris]|uniref:RNA-binding S4 domain-containing protein n=1 Tax=Planctellipticum variicoloris TaxID=3064265 RepID=UPI002BE1DD1A|nr:RNA-binding S4 domain-containing protein [Planctomycetaceae bacterium SH412]HTN01262.1 RNA-binding S4 domain-containing protein [Planctomycetaceae bacterium]